MLVEKAFLCWERWKKRERQPAVCWMESITVAMRVLLENPKNHVHVAVHVAAKFVGTS